MTPEREKEFREMMVKDLKKLSWEYAENWAAISLYLDSEHDEGKIDFHLRIHEDKSFYIHPIDKDGKTFDGKL